MYYQENDNAGFKLVPRRSRKKTNSLFGDKEESKRCEELSNIQTGSFRKNGLRHDRKLLSTTSAFKTREKHQSSKQRKEDFNNNLKSEHERKDSEIGNNYEQRHLNNKPIQPSLAVCNYQAEKLNTNNNNHETSDAYSCNQSYEAHENNHGEFMQKYSSLEEAMNELRIAGYINADEHDYVENYIGRGILVARSDGSVDNVILVEILKNLKLKCRKPNSNMYIIKKKKHCWFRGNDNDTFTENLEEADEVYTTQYYSWNEDQHYGDSNPESDGCNKYDEAYENPSFAACNNHESYNYQNDEVYPRYYHTECFGNENGYGETSNDMYLYGGDNGTWENQDTTSMGNTENVSGDEVTKCPETSNEYDEYGNSQQNLIANCEQGHYSSVAVQDQLTDGYCAETSLSNEANYSDFAQNSRLERQNPEYGEYYFGQNETKFNGYDETYTEIDGQQEEYECEDTTHSSTSGEVYNSYNEFGSSEYPESEYNRSRENSQLEKEAAETYLEEEKLQEQYEIKIGNSIKRTYGRVITDHEREGKYENVRSVQGKWEICVDDNGAEFYYNTDTKQSTWMLPEELQNRKVSEIDNLISQRLKEYVGVPNDKKPGSAKKTRPMTPFRRLFSRKKST